jgi:hypothetical protein
VYEIRYNIRCSSRLQFTICYFYFIISRDITKLYDKEKGSLDSYTITNFNDIQLSADYDDVSMKNGKYVLSFLP